MTEQSFQVAIKAIVRNSNGDVLLMHVPARSGNPPHWDMPGGRMDKGESMIQTLRRELAEEITVEYSGEPKQLLAFISNLTLLVNNERVPLVFVVYEVALPNMAAIELTAETREDDMQWFAPAEAAKKLAVKCPSEFCELVAAFS